MPNTEKRYVTRIALPVAIACAAAYLTSLLYQLSHDEFETGVEVPQTSVTASQTSYDDRAQEIEALNHALLSLDQAYEQRSQNEPNSPQETDAILAQREAAQTEIDELKSATTESWDGQLENAYEEVNDYAQLIGVDDADLLQTIASSQS